MYSSVKSFLKVTLAQLLNFLKSSPTHDSCSIQENSYGIGLRGFN
jgi:hypothetical protein